ncbi:seryl-tRNA synthetase [Coprinopsis marcescibilis]|uniref:serine--tRNA ligase n=1 Tax=Coprinopsis marcescibilis TaxID=230819 RepID=A0A5C3LQ53_COPMA|nr:seryl-tRNA synthetase [Coprinopsis marcescibilis]
MFSLTQDMHSELPPPRLDYRALAENVGSAILNAQKRAAAVSETDLRAFSSVYEDAKRVSKELNSQRHQQSQIGDRIRTASNDEERGQARQEAAALKLHVQKLQTRLQELEQLYQTYALQVPNETHPGVPVGPESEAVVTGVHGPPMREADPQRDHVAIAKQLDLLDLESGATVTGSSWYFLKNEAALLEMALSNYAMSIAIKHGFTPTTTPDVVRSDVAIRCGFQPRDSSENPVSHMYHLVPNHETAPLLILSGTAEIPLAGMFANKVYPQASLPLKYVGIGHAFRQEAGARSADTRGLYRVHQFTKVELFAVTDAEASEAMMEELRQIQTEVLSGLNLHFRILDMPTEELGASAYRKYDMEAWMPGRGSWGEVTSLSNCTDYQSRRLHIRYRPQVKDKDFDSKLPFAHTLNGTAAAIPRLIVALLENGALFDESGKAIGLRLPEALKPFWPGLTSSKRMRLEWNDA